MQAPELQALRRLLFYSAPEAARWVARDAERPRGVEERTWNRWEAGKVQIPPNIGAAVLDLVAWRSRYRSTLLGQLATQPGGTLRLIWYAEADDWPEARELWRPAQSVIASVLAESDRVQLVAYDLRACQAWQRAHGRPDDLASRADWAASVAPTYAIPGPPATHSLRITVPDGLAFEQLKLARDPATLEVSFDWAPIDAICEASGLDPALFREQHEDNVAGLIHEWYLAHLAAGGARDPVQDQIRAEVEAEQAAGGEAGVISHGGGIH